MEIPSDMQTSAHESLRARLASRYGVRGEYVGAAAVARILGVGLTTVYEQAKQGRFVIPHRLANRKPLFLLDDLVAWMLGAAYAGGANSGAPLQTPVRSQKTEAPSHVFEHPEAEEAFLQVLRARGLAAPKSR
jgi:hypothetical protein